jgi:hypothetical protein
MAKSRKPSSKPRGKKKGKPRGRKKSDFQGLDVRRKKYVAGRLSGKSKKASALEAGFSESMAENAGAKIETGDVRRAFQQLARRAVPAEKIVKRLQEGLDATWITRQGRGRKAVCIEEPYFRERREYLMLAAQFAGYYLPKQLIEAEVDDIRERKKRIREMFAAYAGTGVTVEDLFLGDDGATPPAEPAPKEGPNVKPG